MEKKARQKAGIGEADFGGVLTAVLESISHDEILKINPRFPH